MVEDGREQMNEAGWGSTRIEVGRGGRGGGKRDSHQQTRFSTGTITNNDQLSTEFGHFGEGV